MGHRKDDIGAAGSLPGLEVEAGVRTREFVYKQNLTLGARSGGRVS